MRITASAKILPGTDISALYSSMIGNYPKFYKMDILSKLGLLCAEMLVREENNRFEIRHDRAVMMFSREGCVCNDRNFQKTINDFPSPALFVYTLPNIVTGEIAIRNKYAGETSAFVLPSFDAEQIYNVVEEAFYDNETTSVLCGWVDCRSEQDYTAIAWLVERDGEGFTYKTINDSYYE